MRDVPLEIPSRREGAPPRTNGTSSQTSGTPGYIAPEVLRHETDVDQRADLFALGVVLYELLTGVHPFDVGAGAGGDDPRDGRPHAEATARRRAELPAACSRTCA